MHTPPLLRTMAALNVAQLAEDIIAMPVADPADPADLEPVILTDGHRYFDRHGVPLTAPEPLIKKGIIEQYLTKSQTGSCSMASDFGSRITWDHLGSCLFCVGSQWIPAVFWVPGS